MVLPSPATLQVSSELSQSKGTLFIMSVGLVWGNDWPFLNQLTLVGNDTELLQCTVNNSFSNSTRDEGVIVTVCVQCVSVCDEWVCV